MFPVEDSENPVMRYGAPLAAGIAGGSTGGIGAGLKGLGGLAKTGAAKYAAAGQGAPVLARGAAGQVQLSGGGLKPPAMPPSPRAPATAGSEVDRSLRQAQAMMEQDRPGAISKAFDKVTGLKRL